MVIGNERSKMLNKWQKKWLQTEKGKWTKTLIKIIGPWYNRRHSQLNYWLTQGLTGHGCFPAFLLKFKRTEAPNYNYCNSQVDDANHTLFDCDAWETRRFQLRTTLGVDFNATNMVQQMLKSEEKWRCIVYFVNEVILKKEEDKNATQLRS
jgi:hypothetical protein